MSIATKLAELTEIRASIRTALAGKGVTATDHDYADFSTDIESIQTGGGGGEEGVSTPFELPMPTVTVTVTEV